MLGEAMSHASMQPAPRAYTAPVYRERRDCPAEGCTVTGTELLFLLDHLARRHGWTRAQLMAWTDEVERTMEAAERGADQVERAEP